MIGVEEFRQPRSEVTYLRRFASFVTGHTTEILIFVLAFALYLPGITWGLPDATGPDRVFPWAYDDLSPLPALTESYHTFVADSPDHWVAYPLMHYLVLSASYSPYLAWLKLSGAWKAPAADWPYGFADTASALKALTLIARLVSILMGAGVIVIAYRMGTLLWDRRAGLLSAAIACLSYPMFYYTKTANLEIPYLFWTGLGMLVYATMMVRGANISRAGWLGVFAGFAAATKDQTAGFFLPMPLLFLPWRRAAPAVRSGWWKMLMALIAVGAISYSLASGLVLGPHRYLDHVRWLFVGDQVNAAFNNLYPKTLAGTLALLARIPKTLVWWFGPLIVLAAIAGFVERGTRRIALWMLLPTTSYVILFLIPLHYFKARHIVALGLLLALFAARGLSLTMERVSSGVVKVLILVAILAWPAIMSGDLIFQMSHDSRYAAGSWLAANMPAGSRIADCGGSRKLPILRRDVRIVELKTGQVAFQDLAEQQPEFVEVIPDWTGRPGMELSRVCPQSLYDRLGDGSLGYELAASFKTHSLIDRQMMDYPTVNPPVLIYRRKAGVSR